VDYTLAQYIPETFEGLAHDLTKKNLVHSLGYPPAVLSFAFDWRYSQKGLTIDKARGNLLKRDRHNYVKLATHGFRPLEKDERYGLYRGGTGSGDSFDSDNYVVVDTLFSLAEAHLFMQLVELRDHHPELFAADAADGGGSGGRFASDGGGNGGAPTYKEIFNDIRGAVDLCHRDGSLKKEVAKDPAKYIYRDPALVDIFAGLRRSGKQVFIATNSLWDYTNVVMSFLLEDKTGDKKDTEWLRHVDVVLTGCAKPGFFSSPRPLYEVHTATNMLFNTDNGSPLVPIDGTPQPQVAAHPEAAAEKRADGLSRVFQGGFFTDLHRLLGVDRGDEILYVGDHIFGDVVKSKKTLNWRTLLVVPELEAELKRLDAVQRESVEVAVATGQAKVLEERLLRLDDAIADAEAAGRSPGDDALELRAELSTQLAAADARRRDVLRRHHAGFHSVWGRVMKTGTQTSFYAHQLERFACLYTSHVANLLLMSSRASFVAPADALPHELTRARRRSASSSPVAADTAARALQSSDDHGAETTGMMD